MSASLARPRRVAAIDIGSNTALLLVADDIAGVWTPVFECAEICRVSEGLDQRGVLADEPVARTRAVVERFGREARQRGVDRVLAVGTPEPADAKVRHHSEDLLERRLLVKRGQVELEGLVGLGRSLCGG